MTTEAKPLTSGRVRTAIKAAQQSGKTVTIPAPGHPGLRLRVKQGGSAVWSWQGRIKGRRTERGSHSPAIVITLGNYPGIGIEEACEKARSARKQAAEGKRPTLTMPDCKTWRQALAIHKSKVGENTAEQYQMVLDNYAGTLADRAMVDITTEDLLKTYQQAKKKSVSQGKKMLDLFGACQKVSRALSPDSDPRLFVDHVGKIGALTRIETPPPRQGRALTVDQIPKWWGLLQAESPSVTRDVAELALLTGLRKSELLKLQWAEIDLKKNWIDLGSRVKSGRPFSRPIGKSAAKLLKARKLASEPGNPWVFPATVGKSGHITDLRRRLSNINKKMGRDVGLHDLRKTYNSRGRDFERREDMEFLLGHASHDVNTRHYTDRDRHIIETVAQRVEDRVLELTNPKASIINTGTNDGSK